ncbi:ABC transporter G family member 7 [Panicum miliaceum]|uniref:ABC transporter G family member 7 n=1 Tax=Panicum miliaceum TaxID=4540 RepID=A0A3L6QWZ3_PANMI|nr:ABC transporter G family member 7 [Panicum miliaceum]
MEVRGLGQLLAALAAALFVRATAGPGPALLPPAEDTEDDETDAEAGGEGGGGVQPVAISWARITCALKNKRGEVARFLLSNVSGEAKPGRLLALAIRVWQNNSAQCAGRAAHSIAFPASFGVSVCQWSAYLEERIAFVRQEDLFFSQLTVRETLSLAAELQLPDTWAPERKERYVNDLLFRLGLVNCADSIVGDAKVRGISGGLDAFQAEKVMETLRQLAEDRHTIICSIHQPRGSVYGKFDDIVLLYQCPDHMNPAEFLADLISVDYGSADSVQSSQKRIENLIETFSNKALVTEVKVAAINTAMAALTKTVGVFPKERTIVDRERAKGSYALGPYLSSKLLAEIPIGAAFPLIFGSILYPMAKLHPTFSRFAKFCGIVTVGSFAALAMGLTVGAMAPTTEAAMALGPSLMTVFIVFGGYYVNPDNTPVIFRAFQGLCINEFKGLQFQQQHFYDIQTGEQALERFSLGGIRIADTLVAQGRILMFWYWST